MKQIMVPYDVKGNMLESSYYDYPNVAPNGIFGVAQWKPNDPFVAKLTFQTWQRGRSAVTIYMTDDLGRQYPMIGRYFFDIIHLMDKGSITGTWKAVKRGATYGLDLID